MGHKPLLVIASVVLLAVPVLAQDRVPETAEMQWCARVEVGSEAIDPLTSGREFSVQKIEDAQLLVLFDTPVAGEHLLEVKLMTPRGHHYQTMAVPIATAASERGTRRPVPTYPRPLEVQVLDSYETRGGARQGTPVFVPVAGTAIVTSSLYGQWQVQLLLDGEPMTCKVRNTFTLTE